MLETMRKDYVRTARAKGLSESAIAIRHMARNALLPVLTVAGVYTAVLLTGSFFVESMLGIPGLGRYFVISVSARDYPVIIGTTMVFAAIIVAMNFIVDVCYAWLDPRVRT
jgi:ABC-type dipeptide/oligopeptide/nickel transport system permease component